MKKWFEMFSSFCMQSGNKIYYVCKFHYFCKSFTTPLGNFEYKTVSADHFNIGLRHEIIENRCAFLIATPTKALCDMIVATPNLRLQSAKAMWRHLEEDLRIDFDVLQNVDTETIRQCVEAGRKKMELQYLLKIFDFFDFGRPKSKKLDNDNIIINDKNYGNI